MLKARKSIASGRLSIYFVFLIISLFSFILIVLQGSNVSKATSSDPDLEVTVREMLALSLVNCDASSNAIVKLDIEPTPTGVFKSNCQTVSVETNAPGYTIKVKSSNTDLTYQNPTTITTLPTIPSTLNTSGGTPAPNTLNSNTWGYAVEGNTSLGFDPSYTINNSSNKFAVLPTSDQTIYQIDEHPTTITPHTLYYGANVTSETMAGTYATTITYTAVGADLIPPPKNCKNMQAECILFTVDPTTDPSTNTTYYIPTSGNVVSYLTAKSYNWDVYVDGYLINTTQCPDGNCTGTSGTTLPNAAGIELSGLTPNPHQILIVPHDEAVPGWGNAFGHHYSTNGTANLSTNKNKLISLDAPFTTKAFAPKTTESTTNASGMFANLFYGCTNLTTAMQILDTYKLPGTITNLSSFLSNAHYGNSKLINPIDLSLLSGWFNANETITNLSSFLYYTHTGNRQLQSAIDLSPISGWFNANEIIVNLDNFLAGIHSGNIQLTTPIDLNPVSNWFNDNKTITNLSGFLRGTHYANFILDTTIDLSPVSNWFARNTTITNLSYFLSSTHGAESGSSSRNMVITEPIDLSPLSNWFYDNETIINLTSFLDNVHSNIYNLSKAIDLSPVSNWFIANNSIVELNYFFNNSYYDARGIDTIDFSRISGWFNGNTSIKNMGYFLRYVNFINGSGAVSLSSSIDLSPFQYWFINNNSIESLHYFLQGTHTANNSITSPVSLNPISGWFNDNTSINNLDGFLNGTYGTCAGLLSPIDLTPLENWFASGRSVTTLSRFMLNTHTNNFSLTLNGQVIFPNWIKTMTNGSGVALFDTDYSFSQTFYIYGAKNGDSEEPKFMNDGSGNFVILSSLGEPSTNRDTYNNRSGISPLNNSNGRWKNI